MTDRALPPPTRALVVCTRRIGDVLLATPLVRSIKRAWPSCAVDMLVFCGTDDVLEGNPDIARVITVTARAKLAEKLRDACQLWRRYDLAVSPLPSDRARISCWVAGRFRVGLVDLSTEHWIKMRWLNRWTGFDDLNTHTVAMGLRIADLLDIPRSYEVVAPTSQTGIEEVLTDLGPRFAVIHAYPQFNYKMWSQEGWVALATWAKKAGLRIALTGGPDPLEQAYVDTLARQFSPASVNLCGKLSLAQTADLLRKASVYIGPDTAVTHLAAAVGTPTVALFGPSNPVKWGPWPRGYEQDRSPWPQVGSSRVGNVFLVQGEAHCVPCMLEGCERQVKSFSECLTRLSPARVIAAASHMLESGSEA